MPSGWRLVFRPYMSASYSLVRVSVFKIGVSTKKKIEPSSTTTDGTSSTLSVVSDAGHKHHLVFINQGAAAYRTWFGVVKAPAATRPLADYELEALQRILGSR